MKGAELELGHPLQQIRTRSFKHGQYQRRRNMIWPTIFATVCALTLAGAATAGQSVSITFDGHDDGLTITKKNGLYVTDGNGSRNGSYAGIGAGPVTVKGFGKALAVGFNPDDVCQRYSGEYLTLLSYPLVTGGNFIVYKHEDGQKGLHVRGFGTYTVSATKPSGHGPSALPGC